MDDDLRYRTELADQFIARLRVMTTAQWSEILTQHRGEDNFYALALELADEATRLLGDERRDAYEAALASRLQDVAGIVATHHLPPGLTQDARRLARGAVHALLVRDAYGFNSGAFGELIRPFRPYLDLGEIERLAHRVRTPPSGGATVTPPDTPTIAEAAPTRDAMPGGNVDR